MSKVYFVYKAITFVKSRHNGKGGLKKGVGNSRIHLLKFRMNTEDCRMGFKIRSEFQAGTCICFGVALEM